MAGRPLRRERIARENGRFATLPVYKATAVVKRDPWEMLPEDEPTFTVTYHVQTAGGEADAERLASKRAQQEYSADRVLDVQVELARDPARARPNSSGWEELDVPGVGKMWFKGNITIQHVKMTGLGRGLGNYWVTRGHDPKPLSTHATLTDAKVAGDMRQLQVVPVRRARANPGILPSDAVLKAEAVRAYEAMDNEDKYQGVHYEVLADVIFKYMYGRPVNTAALGSGGDTAEGKLWDKAWNLAAQKIESGAFAKMQGTPRGTRPREARANPDYSKMSQADLAQEYLDGYARYRDLMRDALNALRDLDSAREAPWRTQESVAEAEQEYRKASSDADAAQEAYWAINAFLTPATRDSYLCI